MGIHRLLIHRAMSRHMPHLRRLLLAVGLPPLRALEVNQLLVPLMKLHAEMHSPLMEPYAELGSQLVPFWCLRILKLLRAPLLAGNG